MSAAEKCPECGAWWKWPSEHRCPPITSINTAHVTATDPFAPSELQRRLLEAAWDAGYAACGNDWMRGYDAGADDEPCPTPTPNPYREASA